jgi:hypothetical protein
VRHAQNPSHHKNVNGESRKDVKFVQELFAFEPRQDECPYRRVSGSVWRQWEECWRVSVSAHRLFFFCGGTVGLAKENHYLLPQGVE